VATYAPNNFLAQSGRSETPGGGFTQAFYFSQALTSSLPFFICFKDRI
jgi:hypothetical protein